MYEKNLRDQIESFKSYSAMMTQKCFSLFTTLPVLASNYNVTNLLSKLILFERFSYFYIFTGTVNLRL